jgi:hypothetical protein
MTGDRSTRSRSLQASLLALALVAGLAACSVGSTGSDFPSPTAIPTPSPASPTPSPTPTRVPDPTPTPYPTPMPTPVDAALEAMLPASLRGIPLQRSSMPASVFTPEGDMCLFLCPSEPGRLAAAAGLRIEDLTVGFAIPTQASDLKVGITAIRFPGVDTSRLVGIRLKAGGHTGVAPPPGSVNPTTVHIGSRTITWVTWPPFYRQGEYLTASGDVLFLIDGAPPSETGVAPDDVALMVRALP